MKQFRKMLRFGVIILLIALASVGIGIFGSVPIPSNKKRENVIEIKVELKEADENKADTVFFNDYI